MKPMSARARAAMHAYRGEHALPADVRTRLVAALAEQHGTADAPVRAPVVARRVLRLVRWAGAGAALVVGIGLSLYPATFARIPETVPFPRLPEVRAPMASEQPSREQTAPPVTHVAAPTARQGHSPEIEAHASARKQDTEVRGPAPAQSKLSAMRIRVSPESETTGRQPARADLAQHEDPAPTREQARASDSQPASRVSVSPSAETSVAYGAKNVASVAMETKDAARPASSLDEEVMQMRTAYDHLRAGEPLRALSALSEHARRFPDGKLVIMRQVARVQALCDLGKKEEAGSEARRFLAQHADSPYAARVRQACIAKTVTSP